MFLKKPLCSSSSSATCHSGAWTSHDQMCLLGVGGTVPGPVRARSEVPVLLNVSWWHWWVSWPPCDVGEPQNPHKALSVSALHSSGGDAGAPGTLAGGWTRVQSLTAPSTPSCLLPPLDHPVRGRAVSLTLIFFFFLTVEDFIFPFTLIQTHPFLENIKACTLAGFLQRKTKQ